MHLRVNRLRIRPKTCSGSFLALSIKALQASVPNVSPVACIADFVCVLCCPDVYGCKMFGRRCLQGLSTSSDGSIFGDLSPIAGIDSTSSNQGIIG